MHEYVKGSFHHILLLSFLKVEMSYLSLFSGIGRFEVAIHRLYGHRAVCVGYSEIDKHAISEYIRHYPTHKNLGDVTQIKKKDIDALGKIDLVVGGFPCSDLSSVRHKGRKGLDGDKSGLFWTMTKILYWVRKNNKDVQIIIENNVSMAHKWRDMITEELSRVLHKRVYCNYFDSSQWVPQRRRRYYWTLRKIPEYQGNPIQRLDELLIPVQQARAHILSEKMIQYINASPTYLASVKDGDVIVKTKNGQYTKRKVPYPTRLRVRTSSTTDTFIRCIDTTPHFLLDYRISSKQMLFIPRYLTKQELSGLFGYSCEYVLAGARKIYSRLYGMSVVPETIMYVLHHLDV